MIDCVACALSGLAAGIAIGVGPALLYRASYRAARADADATRARLALTMVDREAWKSRALRATWGEVLPATVGPTNVVSLCQRRARRVTADLPDRSA